MTSKKLIVPCLILPLAFSCTEKNPQPSISEASKIASPKITVLSNLPDSSKPVRVLLKKPVRRIKAGRPIIHAFLDSSTRKVIPPEEQAAGFFTNYSSDDGLAIDLIWGGFTDKDGNLWFGTDGGGVSRYDGQSFTNYTIKHGLLSNVVLTITQDMNGDIWFGTASGASRFDGRSFTNYTIEDGLAHNVVLSIFEDKSGNIWFGTHGGGVSCYDRKSFTNYTIEHGLLNQMIWDIKQDRNGDLWFGTSLGASRFDGRSFTNYTTGDGLPNNHVQTIAGDKLGNLWLGTWGGGLSRYDGEKFVNLTTADGLSDNNISAILEDRSGNLWIGTKNGASLYDGKTFIRFTTTNGLSTTSLTSITEDKTGNLWFGTLGGGIIRYGGKSFMNYTADHGLGDHLIFGITEGRAGDLWFGNSGGGVVRYDGKSFSTFTLSEGLVHNNARPRIKDKKGNVWIATLGGVSCFDGESFTNYTQADGLCSNSINCITETRDGKIWFGSHDRGATCYDGNSFTSYSEVQGLPNNGIECVTEDVDGSLWFGTGEGLSRFDGSSFINYSTANGLPNNLVISSVMDRTGNLWFGTPSGASRFDGRSFTNFGVGQGLPDDHVWAIVIDSAGKIIIGTNKGLAILVQFNSYSATDKKPLTRPAQNDLKNDALKNYTPQFEIYNVSAGYPIKDLCLQTMIEDSKGNLWMATGGIKTGLIRFNYSGVHKGLPVPVLHNVKINNENVCWQNLLPQSGTKDSVNSGPGPQITEEATTFGFILTGEARDSMRSRFKGIKFDSIRRFYPIPENLVLPYRHNNITIDFGSVEMNSPNLVRYQYIFEGYDQQWNSVTNRTSVTFGNIYEGTYIFKLRAQNSFGIWSDPVAFTFRVLPPWYRTFWAYGLYVLVFSTAIWGFVKWRIHAVKKENKALEEKVGERTKELEQSLQEKYEMSKRIESQQALLNERLRISRELHDDIGSTLGSISIYSEVAKKRTEKHENTNEVLSKIGLASRELIDKISDIVWSLNPDNESFEQLQHRMMAFAAMILAPGNIRYDFYVDEKLKVQHLRSEQRKNIFLIFKEALYNIVKYADCKNVHIFLTAQKNNLAMIIQDDGKGFGVSEITTNGVLHERGYIGGNGIKNMKARAEDMNASLHIESKINEGTTVQLALNL